MLDDAVACGRQTKGKYILVLLLLAAAALFGAWSVRNPWNISSKIHEFYHPFMEKELDWQPMACGPEAQATALGAGICLQDEGQFTILDRDGKVVYSLESGTETLVPGFVTGAYEPLGRTLYLLGEENYETLTISGGIDAVVMGEKDHFAVITAGSGYLTKTEIYDASGSEIGEIGLIDAAMAAGAFLQEDQLLAALCVGTDGLWRLRIYDLEGSQLTEQVLETEGCREILPCGDGVAVRTEQGLLFFDATGIQTGIWEQGSQTVADWACSENGFAILVLEQGRDRTLKTIADDGTVLGEAELEEPVRALAVCGNTVCALDFGQLRVYDKNCEPTKVSREGARAAGIVISQGACWLLGDGELRKLFNT